MNDDATSESPPMVERLLVCVAVALFGAILSELQAYVVKMPLSGRPDFDQVWFAARAMWSGRDAYALIGPGREFQWPWHFYYPLTAAVVIGPLAALPLDLARTLFVAISSGLLGFAVTKDGYDRLPLFLSGAYVLAARIGQWSPLLTAAILLPGMAWVYAAKPNLGIAFLGSYGGRRALLASLVGGSVVLAIALALHPRWPLEWLALVRTSRAQHSPVVTWIGPVALLALLRWRRPEARLIVLMAVIPYTLQLYELLPLMLVARTRMQTMVLALLSSIAFLMVYHDGVPALKSGPTTYMLLVFLPAVIMVLRRPNEWPARAPRAALPHTDQLPPRTAQGTTPARSAPAP